MKRAIVPVLGAVISLSLGRPTAALPYPQGSFEKYINSNSRFGTKLFKSLYAADPDKNIIFSPLGISSLFACLREGTRGEIRNELDKAFEWAPDQELGPPHRRLTARFIFPSFPSPEEERRREAKKRLDEDVFTDNSKIRDAIEGFYLPREDSTGREELWLKNSLQFHGLEASKAFSERFLEKAQNDYGLKFDEVKDAKEWNAAISRFPGVRPMLDLGASEQYFFILNSVVNLKTEWRRDTFAPNHPISGEFLTVQGSRVPVRMLVSLPGIFPYAKTENYEAVVLPAENADFVVVMPKEGISLMALAEAFAEDPDFLVPRLERRPGDVQLPEVNFAGKEYLRSHLESLGAKTIFNDLGDLVRIPESRLLAVEQVISFEVDLMGIHTKAITSTIGVYGGVLGTDEGFHMKINRPFLFQIRDNVTGVLLFMGAVTDPSRHSLA
ncbi:MAG: serpin family protein [Candidatus Aminicenantes bacterium]|nr:serpin family protein [Candidatus Aminicenantes bacterium]